MKARILFLGPMAIYLALATAGAAQTPPPESMDRRQTQERMQNERQRPPVYALETREALAIAFTEDDTSVPLRGTERLPDASGEAKVERRSGATEIEVELDEMKSASHFGGDFNTYVLWTISPEGLMSNAGEFVLEGNRSKLNVTTPLQTFAMVVTTEPHFAVTIPSSFVVLESTWPADVRPQPTPPVATMPQPTTPRPATPPTTPGATAASQANAGVVILVHPAEPVTPPAPAPPR